MVTQTSASLNISETCSTGLTKGPSPYMTSIQPKYIPVLSASLLWKHSGGKNGVVCTPEVKWQGGEINPSYTQCINKGNASGLQFRYGFQSTICSLEKSKTTAWGHVAASYKRGLERRLLHVLQICVLTTEALLFGFSFTATHHTKTAMQSKMKHLRDTECHN